ncbi:outer membrane lipoprotein chaperone LolA [Corallincola platygyrae]|uniref:Outer-membrane lipoprotein carrier protein n=1 Tax=Corallincola platygyrae TaxID=1193278 RepID=A0ABW4XHX5_9GAMM
MILTSFKKLASVPAVFVYCMSLVVASAFAADKAPEKPKTLRDRLASYQSFSAEFNQQVHSFDGELVQEATGVIKVKTPDQFVWETISPDEHLVQSDGNTVWVFNPLLEQVSLYSAQDVMKDSPILLLAENDPKVWAQYRVRVVGERYEVTPLEAGGNIERFELQFAGNQLTELLIVDSQGQRSQFKLTKFTAPAELAEGTFSFVVPEGVDVDDQRAEANAG